MVTTPCTSTTVLGYEATLLVVSFPDPTLKEGKWSGDIGEFSWSCAPSLVPIQIYANSHMIAELAELTKNQLAQMSSDLFLTHVIGSGNETTLLADSVPGLVAHFILIILTPYYCHSYDVKYKL